MSEKSQVGFEYRVTLRLKKEDIFFGPGTSELLQLVETTGSLNKAAETMGMAYSKAWRIIKFAEEKLGYPLIARKVGGVGGGGSALTQKGKTFLSCYQAFESEAKQQIDSLFEKYFKEN